MGKRPGCLWYTGVVRHVVALNLACNKQKKKSLLNTMFCCTHMLVSGDEKVNKMV